MTTLSKIHTKRLAQEPHNAIRRKTRRKESLCSVGVKQGRLKGSASCQLGEGGGELKESTENPVKRGDSSPATDQINKSNAAGIDYRGPGDGGQRLYSG